MIDLVVIVYEKEIKLLALQAVSVARYGKDIDRIVIINNASTEDKIEPVNDRIRKEVIPHYGQFADRVVLHDVKQLTGKTYPTRGWESQQILKFNSGSLCTPGNVVIILDAKNYFIHPFDLQFLLDGDKIRMFFFEFTENNSTYDVFEKCCRVWDLSDEQIKDCAKGFPLIAPFVLHVDVLRDCAESYKERCGEYQINPMIHYEFFLIGAYLHHRFGRIQNYYTPLPMMMTQFTHRKEWFALTKDKREQMLQYMLNHRLFDLIGANEMIDQIIQDVSYGPLAQ